MTRFVFIWSPVLPYVDIMRSKQDNEYKFRSVVCFQVIMRQDSISSSLIVFTFLKQVCPGQDFLDFPFLLCCLSGPKELACTVSSFFDDWILMVSLSWSCLCSMCCNINNSQLRILFV